MTRRHFFLASGLPLVAAPTRLRIAAALHLNLSAFHLGIEKGYFREQGFEIELVPLARSADAIPVLAQGGIDAAIYAINPPLINAISKGVRVRLVAARDNAQPDCGDTGSLYTRRSITSIAALKGRRVANSQAAGILEFALDTALAKAGLAPSSVEVVLLRPAEAAAAMERGDVDAMTGSELASLKALQKPDYHCLTTLGRTQPGFQFGFISFGRKLLDGPPDQGTRFLSAFYRGAREFSAGASPKFMDEYAESSGLDLKSIRGMCRTHYVQDGRIHRPSLEQFISWAHRKGYCEQPVTAASLIDERFLSAAGR